VHPGVDLPRQSHILRLTFCVLSDPAILFQDARAIAQHSAKLGARALAVHNLAVAIAALLPRIYRRFSVCVYRYATCEEAMKKTTPKKPAAKTKPAKPAKGKR
jgi:hypothetical protein